MFQDFETDNSDIGVQLRLVSRCAADQVEFYKNRYDRREMTVRMTEAELARDLRTVLDNVRQGVEVVIERDSRPVAVLKAPLVRGHRISEVIA